MGPGRKLQQRRILFLRSILLALFLLPPILLLAQKSQPPAQKAQTPPAAAAGYVGSEACQTCHADIYRTYSQTAMARASGPATQELIPGEFQHAASGVHYRVYTENDDAWLSFERPGDPSVKGTRRLLYFIGSGHRGRTYLFAVDGFVFESPINLVRAAARLGHGSGVPVGAPNSDEFAGLAGLLELPHQQRPNPGTGNRKQVRATPVRSSGNYLREMPRTWSGTRLDQGPYCESREITTRVQRCHLHAMSLGRERCH
jgi:hypothetical protein